MAAKDTSPSKNGVTRIPRLIRRNPDHARPLSPDTEDNVTEQTEDIFRSFMYQRYQQEMSEGDLEQIDQTPPAPELTEFSMEPTSNTARIGRQLAMIGDDINARYATHFDGMVKMLDIKPHTAYEAFAAVAKRLLRDGQMNWGRVITLLCFGYRIAMSVLTRGIRGFFRRIISFMVRFIVSEKIAKWIAEQGGWIASLQYVPESISFTTLFCIGALAAATICAAVWLSKR